MDVGNVGGGMTVQQVTGGLDLEAFMMSVSAERANNLENQMAGQINEIKERQDEIKELNQLLADVRSLKDGNDPEKDVRVPEEVKDRLAASGCTVLWYGTGNDHDDVGHIDTTRDENNNKVRWATNQTVDLWVNELKGQLDNLNSTSQMDMIRLQSLSNKRNQAFELLTNQVQKFSKVNDSVIGNMR